MPFYPISSQVRLPGCMRGVACGVRCTVNGGAFSATGFEKLLHQGFHTGSLAASIGVWGCYGNFKFRRERLAVRVVHPPRRRTMASCYGSISAPSTGITDDLQCLPIRTVLPDGTGVEIDYFRESEHEAGQDLLNGVIEEGLSWPFEEALDMAAFRAYFLSHAAFVVRAIPSPPPADTPTPTTGTPPYSGKGDGESRSQANDDTKGGRSSSGGGGDRTGALQQAEQAEQVAVWGVFYIKPNFPGRCSHVCNGGFITDPRRRRRGVARLMGHAFLRLARELGYKASYFNLVFRNNEASLRLWRGLGFTELAVVPKAGRLRGIDGLVDAIQFYYDLELLRESDLPEDLRGSTGVAKA